MIVEQGEKKKIIVLSGAGMSTDSGIPDFRGKNGYWTSVSPTEPLSNGFYTRRPKDFWKLYKDLFKIKLTGQHQPNRGHLLIRELEKFAEVTVMTQNIDGLHQDAGSTKVFEMHGTYKTATCPKCKKVYDLNFINQQDIPRCTRMNAKKRACAFILKPDVVLFGDTIRHWREAEEAVQSADICLIIGTSLQVSPFNLLPELVASSGGRLVFINQEGTEQDGRMHEIRKGNITTELSLWMKEMYPEAIIESSKESEEQKKT